MTRWYTEKKREHFYKEAKRVGYRARSAFKLQQIQKRFNNVRCILVCFNAIIFRPTNHFFLFIIDILYNFSTDF